MQTQSRTQTPEALILTPPASALRADALPLLLTCLFSLSAALLLSCYSGYRAVEAPFDIRWLISPLGLLTRFEPGLYEVENAASFSGTFSWSLDYFAVFLKTCVLEAPFYYLALRDQGRLRFLAILVAANLMTHPLVFFFFTWAFRSYMHGLFAAEVFAHGAEAALIYVLCRSRMPAAPARRCAGLIVAANLFSWQVGVLLG